MYLVRVAAWILFALLYALIIMQGNGVVSGSRAAVLWVLGVFVVIGLVYIMAWLSARQYRYAFLPDAFLKECGIFFRRRMRIPYERILHVELGRGFWDRRLHLWDVYVHADGYWGSTLLREEGKIPCLSHAEADTLRTELMARVHRAQARVQRETIEEHARRNRAMQYGKGWRT